MADFDDVAALALALPGVSEGTSYGRRGWTVGGKTFVWERPFSKADLKRFGDEEPPSGPILGARVDDLGEKEAVLSAGTAGLFTIPHFDGYAAVLVQLEAVAPDSLAELVVDAWLATAPRRLADEYAAEHGLG